MIKPMFVTAALAFVAVTVASAQTPPADGPPSLRLGLGDLMTMLVQPRHIKVGIGGQVRNWDYIAYEIHELEEAFERIERAVPRYRNVAMSDLLKLVQPSIEALEASVKARDGAKFDVAYDQLTQACNACHRSTEHAMIVIQAPKTSPFPDQNFAPQRP
jgi:hypothetical protein